MKKKTWDLQNYKTIIWLMALTTFFACNKGVMYGEAQQNPELNIAAAGKKKLLIVSIEGARGDVVQNAPLPTIHQLTSTGVFCWGASSDSFTTDRASWATLLTGVFADKSGVTGNSYAQNDFKEYPTFLSRLQKGLTGINMSVVNSDPAINDSIIHKQDIGRFIQVADDKNVQDSAINQLKDSALDVLLVNYSAVNAAGKASGFDASSAPYMAALTKVDTYIGQLVHQLQSRPGFTAEQWMIVVISNHGGTDQGHYGGGSREERNTFAIYNVQGLLNQEITPPDINIPYDGVFPYFSSSNPGGGDSCAYVNNPIFNFGDAQDFTVEFKIKTTGADIDNPIITNKDWTSGGNTGWNIILYENNIRINFKGLTGSRVDVRNGPTVNDNKWHHISVVFNRLGDIFIYEDGNFYVDGGSISGQGSVDTKYPLVVGSDGLLNYQTRYSGALHSSIADIRVWKTALSSETIKKWALKSSMDGHPNSDALVGYWKANDNVSKAGTITDFSSSKADLTINKGLRWDMLHAILNPSSVDAYALVPSSADLTANALAWMGLKIDPSWNLDSKIWIIP